MIRHPLNAFLFVLTGALVWHPISAQPRVYSYDAGAVVRAREAYRSGTLELKPALDQLRKDADAALREPLRSVMDKQQTPASGDKHDYMSLARYFWPDSTKPNGLPYVNRDGVPNPEILTITDATHFGSMVEAAHTLSLASYIFGEERYAERASKVIRTWFLDSATAMNPNLNHAQAVKGMDDGRPAGTIETRNFGLVCDAATLLVGSKAWTPADQAGLTDWCRKYLHWLTTAPRAIAASNFENNIAIWFSVQAGSIALFVNDLSAAQWIFLKARAQAIDTQIEPDGGQPHELTRTTSSHYVFFNLEAFFRLAWLAEHAGVNLWQYRSPDGRSLRGALDWVMPYLRGEKKWTWQQIKPFNWDVAYYSLLQQASSRFGDPGYGQLARRLAGNKKLADRSNLIYGTSTAGPSMADITSKVFLHADAQLRSSIKDLRDGVRFPRATNPDGTWKEVPITDWTSGFFPGCLWYMYEHSKDSDFLSAARLWTEKLEPMQHFTGNHDIGFMIFNSFGNGYRLTSDRKYREVILQAARTAVTRYNSQVGCIKSWDNPRWEYPVIVDNMMNLELLFWAVQNGEDSSLYRIAVSHAERTMKNHVRADGSTFHVISYDSSNGTVIGGYTAQGYSDSSTWARGQAWAIYGFTMAYRFTRDERFLNTAQRVANYFIDHLPADHIPFWDFNAPEKPHEPRDASAAAIAASGLLELSTYTADTSQSGKLFSTAESILRSLASDSYSSAGSSSRGITLHSVTSKPAQVEVDVTLIYADYYFLEALLKYRNVASKR